MYGRLFNTFHCCRRAAGNKLVSCQQGSSPIFRSMTTSSRNKAYKSEISPSREEDRRKSHEIQVEERNATIGKQVVHRCVTERLIDKYPDIETSKLIKMNLHTCDHQIPKAFKNISDKGASSSVLAQFGSLYLERGIDLVNQLLDRNLSFNFSDEDINQFVEKGHETDTCKLKSDELDSREGSDYEAVKHPLLSQRVLKLTREENESFGFYIRGGEKREYTTNKYRKLYAMTPIYVSRVVPDSIAAKSGLEVGDVILAVGDFTMKNESHRNAVRIFSEQTDMRLTVLHDESVMKEDQLMMELDDKDDKKTVDQIKEERWRKWHEAQAKAHPDKYIKFFK